MRKILHDPDGTTKILLTYPDAAAVEAVLLEDRKGRKTACLSTQAGCAMGCLFCKTGSLGLLRNLSAPEIVEQFLQIRHIGGIISNIVFMGMGEPFMNFDNLLSSIAVFMETYEIAPRRMTVSTCGLVPGILRLADSKVPVGLAVSLPTVREDLRKTLMPAAAEYSLDSLKEALDEYGKKTRKRPTVSVVIIRNVNDGGEDARSLADFLAGLRVLVNLIPYNKTNLHSFSEPEAGAIQTYYEILSAKNIPAVRRCPRGAAIGGACGQLGPVSRRHENLFEGAGRPIFR